MSWIVKNKLTGKVIEIFDKKNYEIALSKPEKYEITPIHKYLVNLSKKDIKQ